MAKQSETKPNRTLADFPEYKSAVVKLNDLAAQREAARRELVEANERDSSNSAISSEQHRIDEAAMALLTGQSTATISKSRKVLAFEFQSLEKAALLQQEAVDKLRRKAASEIAKEMIAEHKEIVKDVYSAGQHFIATQARIARFREKFAAAAGGQFEAPLLELDLNPQLMNRVKNDVGVFAQFAGEYVHGK
jgi:hypothetical protein